MFELLAQEQPHPIAIIPLLLMIAVVYFVAFYPIYRIAVRHNAGPAFMAFIPFFNLFLMTSIAEVSVLWVLAMFVPVLNIVAGVWVLMGICKRCNKEPLLGFSTLLPPLNLIVLWYLALSD